MSRPRYKPNTSRIQVRNLSGPIFWVTSADNELLWMSNVLLLDPVACPEQYRLELRLNYSNYWARAHAPDFSLLLTVRCRNSILVARKVIRLESAVLWLIVMSTFTECLFKGVYVTYGSVKRLCWTRSFNAVHTQVCQQTRCSDSVTDSRISCWTNNIQNLCFLEVHTLKSNLIMRDCPQSLQSLL